jgi:hypothetical protein
LFLEKIYFVFIAVEHNFILISIHESCDRWQYSDKGTGWTAKELGFDSQQGQDIFLFSITSGLALGPTQPPMQWVLGGLLWGKVARV